MLRQALQYFHTARHLQPVQVFGRLLSRLRKPILPKLPAAPDPLSGSLTPCRAFHHHDPWNNGAALRQGKFRFLNRTELVGWPADWTASGLPLLWKFNLHYFNYLHLLNRQDQLELCVDWVDKNPAGATVGWHPYPASLRIVNWCKLAVAAPELLQSLYHQAAYLYRNIEWHHPGNHLLENARALIFAGRYFNGDVHARAWLAQGLDIYRRETPIQVLADGGHFERSPMYHALMLECYLDVINVLPDDSPEIPVLAKTAKRMGDYLASVTHPHGKIALLNDSTLEIAPPTDSLLQYVTDLLGYQAQKRAALPESGYFVIENEKLYLVIDGGPLGPDYLLAHAHADIFSYELSLQEQPMIVDTGVFEYPAGEMRRFVRSTRAHNTVCVDRTDQAECWSSFRVARRYAPVDVVFQRERAGYKFSGRFDGYARLLGDRIVHRRSINCAEPHQELTVEDTVEGTGSHLVESLIHLHPDVTLERSGPRLMLHNAGASCEIEIVNGSLSIEKGWYCPEFGQKRTNQVLVLSGGPNLPTSLAYKISY
jgi:uncharacterized heparinase superfamily protein